MPLYEYRCPQCSLLLERQTLVKLRDITPVCEVCNTATERIISNVNYDIKGYCYNNEYSRYKNDARLKK